MVVLTNASSEDSAILKKSVGEPLNELLGKFVPKGKERQPEKRIATGFAEAKRQAKRVRR